MEQNVPVQKPCELFLCAKLHHRLSLLSSGRLKVLAVMILDYWNILLPESVLDLHVIFSLTLHAVRRLSGLLIRGKEMEKITWNYCWINVHHVTLEQLNVCFTFRILSVYKCSSGKRTEFLCNHMIHFLN